MIILNKRLNILIFGEKTVIAYLTTIKIQIFIKKSKNAQKIIFSPIYNNGF